MIHSVNRPGRTFLALSSGQIASTRQRRFKLTHYLCLQGVMALPAPCQNAGGSQSRRSTRSEPQAASSKFLLPGVPTSIAVYGKLLKANSPDDDVVGENVR